MEGAGAPPRHIGLAGGAGDGDVTQRVGARIVKGGRIRRAANADGIHH
jgi:hypothetical protein